MTVIELAKKGFGEDALIDMAYSGMHNEMTIYKERLIKRWLRIHMI
jgi:hypothetical protein